MTVGDQQMTTPKSNRYKPTKLMNEYIIIITFQGVTCINNVFYIIFFLLSIINIVGEVTELERK